jgi:hypothetical protein
LGQKLKIVGQREKNTQDQEREADDGYGEDIPDPVLPEIVQGFLSEILEFL